MTAAAPIGAVVSIAYTADPGVSVDAGDVLRTSTNRLYRVLVAKQGRDNLRRYSIRALVIEAAEPGRYQTHELHWNKRTKKQPKPAGPRPTKRRAYQR